MTIFTFGHTQPQGFSPTNHRPIRNTTYQPQSIRRCRQRHRAPFLYRELLHNMQLTSNNANEKTKFPGDHTILSGIYYKKFLHKPGREGIPKQGLTRKHLCWQGFKPSPKVILRTIIILIITIIVIISHSDVFLKKFKVKNQDLRQHLFVTSRESSSFGQRQQRS